MNAAGLREHLDDTARVIAGIDATALSVALDVVFDAWERDATVFICGNGGSATTASHMACDLSKQTMLPGRRPLRALSLTDNFGLISAWANDSDFATAFAEQLRIHGRTGDVLVAISASGNSANIDAAVAAARGLDMAVIGMTGFSGGRLGDAADIHLHVPSEDYGMVESAHLAIEHSLTSLLPTMVRTPPLTAGLPLVILDRDGVINRNRPDGVRRWEDFEFLPGVLEALATFDRHGIRVVVVTNQANIARGKLTVAQLNDIHRRMGEAVILAGGRIHAVYSCPHDRGDGCDCRKPRPGLLESAAAESNISLSDAYVIGDHVSDIQAARATGATPVLVLSGRHVHGELDDMPAMVAGDLLEAAGMIVRAHAEPEAATQDR